MPDFEKELYFAEEKSDFANEKSDLAEKVKLSEGNIEL